MSDNSVEVIRSQNTKRSDPFVYCKWAAGDWEARFYINTPAHLESREDTIKQILNNPAWCKSKGKKIDPKQAVKNNKAKGTRKKR